MTAELPPCDSAQYPYSTLCKVCPVMPRNVIKAELDTLWDYVM